MSYRFADLDLDLDQRRLRRDGRDLELSRLSFDVLTVLVEAAPRLVTHDELIDRAWGENRVVTPENLYQRITMVRKALGDDAKQPVYIEAVRGAGFRLIPPVERGQVHAASHRPTGQAWWLGALVIGLVGVTVIFNLERDPAVDPGASTVTGEARTQAALPAEDFSRAPSIAVLPFVNMSDDPANEYVGDGIAEEIINTLVSATSLMVVARTYSFQFKGQAMDSTDMGTHLGASHLLEGSVRRSGDELRITAQLVDALSGYHLWSQQYDRADTDLFGIQTEIAAAVVAEIRSQLEAQGEDRLRTVLGWRRVPARGAVDPKAYEVYLKGLQARHRVLPDSIAGALVFFEEAVRLDPLFFEAWEALIDTQLLATTFPMMLSTPADAYGRIEAWLDIAMPLHPDHPYLELIRGSMLALNHYRWSEGVAAMDRAIPGIRNRADALAWAGMVYLMLNFHGDAAPMLARSHKLDPSSPMALMGLSWLYFMNQRQQDATDLMEAAGLEYFTAANAGILNFAINNVDGLDSNLREARGHVPADHPAIEMLEALLLAARGQYEQADELGDRMVDQMREKPYMQGWLTHSPDRKEEVWAIAEEQRHMIQPFWLRDPSEHPPEGYWDILNMDDMPSARTSQVFLLSDEQRDALLAQDMGRPVAELEAFVGDFGTGYDAYHFDIEDGRLHYQSRYFTAQTIAAENDRFISLLQPDVEFQFLDNKAGEIDLCVVKDGQMTYYLHRQWPLVGPN